jgi:hypothetical protein
LISMRPSLGSCFDVRVSGFDICYSMLVQPHFVNPKNEHRTSNIETFFVILRHEKISLYFEFNDWIFCLSDGVGGDES